MAVIERIGSMAEWDEKLRKLDRGSLIGQQMCQRGAIDALEFLVEFGATPKAAQQMLDSLRDGLMRIHQVAIERGIVLVGYEDPDVEEARRPFVIDIGNLRSYRP